MEKQPVDKKQGLETATLLKKGKYGFYKQVDKIHSVYGDDEPKPIQKPMNEMEEKQPVIYSAFLPATETHHYIHPEKIQEILQGFIPDVVKPYFSIDKGKVKEGFEGGLEQSTQALNDQINGSTQSIQNEGSVLYKQLTENWIQIQDDVNTIGDPNSSQSDKLKSFFYLIRDFLAIFYTLISVFNVNTHPNFIDIMGETLTKMFVETDTGGLIDPEKSRLTIYYFTMIAYASVFIFIAYIASENWYYFLFYEFSEDIMTNVINKDGKTEKKEWSLQVWWSYYEKNQPNLFGLFHALFYIVTAIDTMLRRLRENTKGYFDNYSPIIRVGLFLGIYYLFNYWVSMTTSPAFDIIFMIVMGFAVFRICMMSFGSFSFVPASKNYPPSLFSFVVTLIKGIVLWTLDYSLISIGKMAVYVYIMFISFGIISFSETKRKDRGIIGRFFDTVREMRDYLLLNAKSISGNPNAGFPSIFAYTIENSWLSIAVFLVFFILLMTLIPNTKDIQLFAPIYYFILIFMGITVVKFLINNAKMFLGIEKPNTTTTGTLDYQRGELSKNLSQGPLNFNRLNPRETQYKTGVVDALNIGKNIIQQKGEEIKNIYQGDTGSLNNVYNLGKKISNELKPW